MEKYWTEQELDAVLRNEGLTFEKKAIDYGIQYRCQDRASVNLYTTSGKAVPGGADTATRRKIEEILGQPVLVGPARNRVFVVYGHDEDALKALELVLRRLGLEPVILRNEPSKGQTIIEKIEENIDVQFACALLTPDDEGHASGKPDQRRPRARQNVVLELGICIGRLGRERVAILHRGSLELPSDIAGLIYIPFEASVEEAAQALAKELEAAGLAINWKGVS